ncbi:hypothetical protein G4Z16_24830 [Streptomyces bathyalis]|uniref:Uncharacterized protein n=1 Tax=Streptomyces bathyalis TaxID=2710756 RepID=A0A7T1WTZ0_9ACTN|nr:hypothetical protein G4Z16_24830 [Streptomyces bathyalis]
MTACAPEAIAADSRTARHSTFTIAADGAYAARLNASAEEGWFPERWTLDGPEPYAVPLPGARPEEPDSQVLPLTDGRVLIARREGGVHRLALLYPTGPSTGELALGSVESERLTLLPPAPCGRRAYALTAGERSTGVWLVAGSGDGVPQLIADVPGRCGGGAWLDREGRLLAIDRTDTAGSGRTKTVAIDLGRGGEVSPLLQITDESDDRLLLADTDSGLLIVRSDAPGEFRLGWGVLGSHRPVRFPESLHPEDALLTPFAVQPGQMLLPESCAVALHGQTTGARAGGAWLGVWRPMQKELRRFRAPGGWLPGKGVWTREGELRLPCATAHAPCGLARLRMRGKSPDVEAGTTAAGTSTGERPGAGANTRAALTAGTVARRALGPGHGPADADTRRAGEGTDAGHGAGTASEQARREAGEDGLEGPAGSSRDGSRSVTTGDVPSAGHPAADPPATGNPADGTGSPLLAPQLEQEASARALPPVEPAGTAALVPPGAMPAEVPRLPAQMPAAQDAGAARSADEQSTGAAQQAVDGPSPSHAPPPSLAVAQTCAGRRPVPLQDAPLATALHDAAVRARTA